MKTELKPGIFIEGFDEFPDWEQLVSMRDEIVGKVAHTLVYEGKTAEIPEHVAKECVIQFINRCKYKNYSPNKPVDGILFPGGFNYASISIQSACSDEYCIIYKHE